MPGLIGRREPGVRGAGPGAAATRFLNGRRLLARAREIQSALDLGWSDAVLRPGRHRTRHLRPPVADPGPRPGHPPEAPRPRRADLRALRRRGGAPLRPRRADARRRHRGPLRLPPPRRDRRARRPPGRPAGRPSHRGPGQALRLGQRPARHARPGPGGDRPPGRVREQASGEVVLSLRGVTSPGRPPAAGPRPARGEVTGVVGLLGAGKTELARGLFGAEPFTAEPSSWTASPYAPRRPADAIRGRRPPGPRGPARGRPGPRLVAGPEHLAAVPQVALHGRAREPLQGGRPRPRHHRAPSASSPATSTAP